jgi:hypothetical protein
MRKVNDARGLLVGPMWARDEAARRNGGSLVHSLRLGAVSACLVLMAYAAAAWLDEAVVLDGDEPACQVEAA